MTENERGLPERLMAWYSAINNPPSVELPAEAEIILEASARIKELEDALGDIAQQHLSTEMSGDETECTDFENGWDIAVGVARKALTKP